MGSERSDRFVPALHTVMMPARAASSSTQSVSSSRDLPPVPPLRINPSWKIPTPSQCMAWWDTHCMLDNIRDHSLAVTHVATTITRMALEKTPDLDDSRHTLETVTAGALLHDLAKTHCIHHGGNHAQIGAAWAVALTNNPAIGHAVFHHIFWPGKIDVRAHFIPLVVVYGDKRVRHDTIVSLEERMDDLMLRYGTSAFRRAMIRKAYHQVVTIEQQLEQLTGVPLHAHSFDSRRLVQ
jgi:hypothetical protein